MAEASIDRFFSLPTRRAGWVVGATLIVTLLALLRLVDLETGGPRLLLDSSLDTLLPAADGGRAFYERARDLFGSDEQLLVALRDDDVVSAESLATIARLGDRLAAVDGVRRVESLASALGFGAGGASIPQAPAALKRLREQVLQDPLMVGRLVAADGRTASIVVHLDDLSQQEFEQRGIDRTIARLAEEERGSATVWLAGGARLKAELSRFLLRDLTLIVPVAVLVMAGVALVALRTFRGVFVPLSTVAIAVVWTLAVIAETVGTLNQVTVAAPPILIVVGFAYAVHVMTAYYDELRAGYEEGAVLGALRHVALPVFLTGVTTAAGFASLATSPLEAIRQFGLFTALGVVFTTWISLTYAPAVLELLPVPGRFAGGGDGGARTELLAGRRFDRMAERLAAFDLRHRGPILLAGAVVAVVALVGMTRVRVGTDLLQNFGPETSVRADYEAVNSALDGANVFYVVLESGYRGAFQVPENLRTLERLQEWIDARPGIGGTTSLLDHMRAAARSRGGDAGLPASRGEAAALIDAVPEGARSRFLDSRQQTANIVVRSRAIESGGVVAQVRDIEEHLATLPRNLIPRVTGNTVLISRTVDEIALGQALSLGTAFVIIYVILSLLFASPRVGLVALVPNVLPVLVYFGVLGFSGVTLNTTTGLVASLVLGIAVDDTIHYMARFNAAARRHADEAAGAAEALRSVGRPVTYTTVALCLGFLTLTLSELRNQVEFGVLAAVTLGFAWLVDVTFTPALAAHMRVVGLWEILSLDLGPEPHRSIPLFAGLGRTQARIVATMATIRTLPEGRSLAELGNVGHEMYVVIEGRLSVSVRAGGDDVTLRTARRGHTVGEVALFHGRRGTDVTALTNVRLLRISDQDLETLRRYYPRTAARLYRNLGRILADQLARSTELVG